MCAPAPSRAVFSVHVGVVPPDVRHHPDAIHIWFTSPDKAFVLCPAGWQEWKPGTAIRHACLTDQT